MVNDCANPKCSKPLHYLRDGRVFVFDVPSAPSVARVEGARGRRMEHYWLCGDCAQSYTLKHSPDGGIELLARPPLQAHKLNAVVLLNTLAS